MLNKRITGLVLISLVAFVVAGLSACTMGSRTPEDPKRRLTEYISRSFAIKSPEDRQELMGFLGGEAKTRLAAWSDEQFRQAFIDSKKQFIKLVFREIKNLSPTEINITYELTFMDQGRGQDAKVTNKKLCQLVLTQGKWYINEVRNLKELVEYRNEMSLP